MASRHSGLIEGDRPWTVENACLATRYGEPVENAMAKAEGIGAYLGAAMAA